ncbi:hypothetical protein COLO4_04184 [Corchorus olitorius]|uniref:Uncharacterized protein n=1 Tax=Corchorus olitorius TaxID=93759 RepID=A0A1R3KV28_9ROSI|nr:hypothetical protein COLO4_04184 [Corchorus olitorius]
MGASTRLIRRKECMVYASLLPSLPPSPYGSPSFNPSDRIKDSSSDLGTASEPFSPYGSSSMPE